MSLRFLPWMIGWMVTTFSKLRKKGGSSISTLEEAGHHGFDFEDLQEWMLTFCQRCEGALNRKEEASLLDYLATYLEMFLYFLLNAFILTWKHMRGKMYTNKYTIRKSLNKSNYRIFQHIDLKFSYILR